jgi:hypothetical protein
MFTSPCALFLQASLVGPGGGEVVRLMVFADKSAYELITQDDVMNDTRTFAGEYERVCVSPCGPD